MSEEQKQSILDELKGYTCTSIFLVPLLKIGKIGETLPENGFVNGYLDDVDKPIDREDCLYLLFRPKNMAQFAIFFADQSNHNPLLVDDYDLAGGFVVLVYNIPEKFLKDYRRFLKGQYSQLSDDFKESHPKLWKVTNVYGKVEELKTFPHKVFDKDTDLAARIEEVIGSALPEGMEVWGIPNIEKETLNIKNFL